MKTSPLHHRHIELRARMLPFAGWEMPIQYQGIVAEHLAVREAVGVFDISHMGEFIVSGEGASKALNHLLTNDLSTLEQGQGQYTLMLNHEGGVIDDLIAYRIDEEAYFLVVNASKIDQDLEWLQRHLPAGVAVEDRSERYGGLAVQGPKTAEIWEQMQPSKSLPARNGIAQFEQGLVLCRTGYTGEDGFELFAPVDEITAWFDRFLKSGAVPCGLGARDTLRLEKGFPLNGADLDERRTPLEAGLGYFVKRTKEGGFVGLEAIENQRAEGLDERLVAIRMVGKTPPPRQGYEVRDEEGEVELGTLTSGSLSPSLGQGIGMAYVPSSYAALGTPLTVMIRDRPFEAEVVKKPFV